jgi:ABC-2 type transport system ATP-binding protein
MYPSQLSSGMRQKAVLCKAFLVHTPVLFLDEPTVGLDPSTSAEVRRIVREEMNQKMGQTVILTTHYIGEAEEICDRVGFLHKGKMIAIDKPSNLVEDLPFHNSYRISVENASPNDLENLVKLSENIKTEMINLRRGYAAIRLIPNQEGYQEDQILPTILNTLRESKVTVLSVKKQPAGLEDSFLHHTGEGIGVV